MTTLAVLGTGLLGGGFVEGLLARGHRVRIWNRSPEKLAPLVERGATAGRDPADAVAGAERVHLVLSEDPAVDAVVAALRPGLGDGVPLLDHSTNLPERVAARFESLRADGIAYLPAPVFMSPQNARDAGGVMLLAGPRGEAEALSPELESMTGRLWYVGERPDLAAVYKLTGNALLVGMSGILGDVFTIGGRHGLQPEQVLELFEVFNPGPAFPAIGRRILGAGKGPPSFELDMARKDVRLMIEAAGARGLVVLPSVAAAMDRALGRGLGSQDYAIFAQPDDEG